MDRTEKIMDEISSLLKGLPEDKIKEVKEFIKLIKRKDEQIIVDRSSLISLMGSIDQEDVEMMRASIEEACERIEINGW